MLQRLSRIMGLGLLTMMLGNCYAVTVGNPANTYFFNDGKSSFSASGFEVTDAEGEACARSIFALVSIGDASVNKAAEKSSIKNIRSVTHRFYPNWFGIHTFCTVVRGSR
ncbi:TRL-like family protein [Leptospira ryugenii]|uniref:TRL-like family protein n=1 Tax=Leptospira ryugenii TaxID=1917863 RepID=A0A2P2E464_9LEPT|nr:TRL domain-containing protein [Leptospira ryugenii]GBF51646.1 TRL-like family protein [Leptospira ryugenii]